MTAALTLHSLKRVRSLVLVLGMLLGGFQVMLILVARSIQRSEAFDQLTNLIPDFVRQLMGPGVIGLMSFSGIVCVGYFHVAVMGAVIGLVIGLATESASEIETRFIDLVLSRPVSRHQPITRSAVLLLICSAFVLSMMVIGTWVGLNWLAPEEATWPSKRLIGRLAMNLGLLMFCWGGIGIGINSFCRRRSVAGSLAGLLALATYLLDYLARAWAPAESIAWISPFRYYNPLDLIQGNPTPWYNPWVLLGLAIAGLGLGYVVFWRRDI